MWQGDLVVRISYGGDIIFKIQEVTPQRVLLKGVEFRLLADAPMHDLTAISEAGVQSIHRFIHTKVNESMRRVIQHQKKQKELNQMRLREHDSDKHSYFEVPGKVLHLDGDSVYLHKSMNLYGEMRVPAEGFYVPEANMAEALQRLLPQVKPDILVLTGHDGILKDRKNKDLRSLSSYKNSHHFVNAIKVAREFDRNRDSLVIIAGACQSYFEAMLQAGANFASSPARVLIHALDPLYIAAKVSFTSIKNTVQIMDVIYHTFSGLEGLGGMETRGCYRIGLPGLGKFMNGIK